MAKLSAAIKKFVSRKEGASLVEYGLLVSLIAVICIAAVKMVGNQVQAAFNSIAQNLAG